jgi:quinol monooxygenase YgiN
MDDPDMLGLIVRIRTETGQRETVVGALLALFAEATRHPAAREARIFRGAEPDEIYLVERWAETLDSFMERARASAAFARFEASTGPFIQSREIMVLDGRPVAGNTAS